MAGADSKLTSSWFRGDVDGLRAIAIVLVVAYHAGLPYFGGGFIGVDVFFVISGFLISRNLLRETETTDRVGLGGFWSRRIRRLVPALALVVTVTLIAGAFILPAFDVATFAKQGGAAALYLSNVLFASEAQDYFAADVSTSPFLHTWSLGVEEQFYLVWPLVFAGACWSQRRRLRDLPGPRRRLVLVVVFGVTLVASLALSISLTASGSTWAFFGLPSRAWEFAVAGLLAVVPVPSFLRPVHARTALAVGGLVVLAAGCGLIDDGTRYPGLWALLPVGGTVLLIVAGETWDGTTAANPVSRLLTLAPLQWLGRVSYSWYLWHWPAIVLVVVAVEDDATSVKTAAALASLPVAWLAYRWFETPLRYSSLIARSHRRTYLAGALATIGVLAVAVGVRSTAPPAADPGLGLAGVSAPPGSSLEDRVAFQVALYRDRSNNSCPRTGGIETPAGDLYCVAGDPNGTRSVMLMGDSHAGQWRRVLDDVAKARGIKLLIRQHNGCAPFKILLDDVEPGVGGGEHAVGCRYMQTGNPRILEDLRPDAIIVGNYAGNGARVLDTDDTLAPRDRQIELWGDAVADLIGEAQQRDIEVGWILDAPKLGRNASSCIVAEQSIEACVPTRDEGFKLSRDVLEAERAALDAAGVEAVLDLPALICDEQVCNLEIDGDLVYVDEHHLTDEFAAAQRQRVDELVQQLLGP